MHFQSDVSSVYYCYHLFRPQSSEVQFHPGLINRLHNMYVGLAGIFGLVSVHHLNAANRNVTGEGAQRVSAAVHMMNI